MESVKELTVLLSTSPPTDTPRKDTAHPNEANTTPQWPQHTELDDVRGGTGLLTFPELELDALSEHMPSLDDSASTSLSDTSFKDATSNSGTSLTTQCDKMHYYAEVDGQPSLDARFLSDIDNLYSPCSSTMETTVSPKCSSTLVTILKEPLMHSADVHTHMSPSDERSMDERLQKHNHRPRNTQPESEAQLNDSNDDSAKFDHILSAMKAVGFSSFDQMAASYYTASFPRSSAAYDMQRQSRIRHLRNFLASVKSDTNSWTVRERRGWLEEIIEEAEDLHKDEVHKLLDGMADGSIEDITGTKMDLGSRKAFYQEHLPDLWSLLSRVVAASGLEQPYSTKMVLVALQVLIESDSTALEHS
jgi:hypothetical protein